MEIILNTGGTAFQGAVIKGGRKFTDEYTHEAAYCDINPEDFEELAKPWYVKVTNRYGDSVILKAKKTDRQQKGEIFIPRGPWANIIVTAMTESTGSPEYKNAKVQIEKASGPVLGPEELMKKYYSKRTGAQHVEGGA
ncbi:MAG: molybdopterin dinucleotide binding domain-containing protein [Halobacteriota archaeon]